jgi:ferrous iron transport protein B
MAARGGVGVGALLSMIDEVATGRFVCRPFRPDFDIEGFREAHDELTREVSRAYPGLSQPQWIALRLLEGDENLRRAVESGDLSTLNDDHAAAVLASREDAP